MKKHDFFRPLRGQPTTFLRFREFQFPMPLPDLSRITIPKKSQILQNIEIVVSRSSEGVVRPAGCLPFQEITLGQHLEGF